MVNFKTIRQRIYQRCKTVTTKFVHKNCVYFNIQSGFINELRQVVQFYALHCNEYLKQIEFKVIDLSIFSVYGKTVFDGDLNWIFKFNGRI